MKPEQLKKWRTKQLSEIKKQAVKLSNLVDDKYLREQKIKRVDQERIFEVMLRNDLGAKMSQYLLEGMDIKGMDLEFVKGLKQQQIDHAIGDASTKLPVYLQIPQAWRM